MVTSRTLIALRWRGDDDHDDDDDDDSTVGDDDDDNTVGDDDDDDDSTVGEDDAFPPHSLLTHSPARFTQFYPPPSKHKFAHVYTGRYNGTFFLLVVADDYRARLS